MFAEYKPYSLKIKNKAVQLSEPVLMGILNTTEDSFFDGGSYLSTEAALRQCERMLKEGALIIDVGGQSSRPGAVMSSEDEEIRRTEPVVEAIARHFPEALISIDSFRAKVAARAIQAGAHIVNDISAGEDDPEMLKTVAELKVPYIAMHKKGLPATMQNNPQYRDVCEDLLGYFSEKKELLGQYGIENLIIDPGFGFGKTLEHNYSLLKHLERFQHLSCPLLVGLSRKSMVWKLLGSDPKNALNGSTALHMLALMQGAHILRVHDVREAAECIRIAAMMRSV